MGTIPRGGIIECRGSGEKFRPSPARGVGGAFGSPAPRALSSGVAVPSALGVPSEKLPVNPANARDPPVAPGAGKVGGVLEGGGAGAFPKNIGGSAIVGGGDDGGGAPGGALAATPGGGVVGLRGAESAIASVPMTGRAGRAGASKVRPPRALRPPKPPI